MKTGFWHFAILLLLLSVNITARNTSAQSDDFEDGRMDTAKWRYGVLSRSTSHFDSAVTAAEVGGRLVITPLSGVNGTNYNGYLSATGVNLTNANGSVEIVERAGSDGQTIFSVGIDKNRFFRFRAKSKTLYLESGGTTTKDSTITFDPVLHRFWRFRHVSATNSIYFETSSDAASWTIRKTIPQTFSITNLIVELNAGTSSTVSSPGKVQFDNVTFSSNGTSPTPSPSPTPSVTPTPTPTPIPSPTTPLPTPTPIPSPTVTPDPVPNDGRSRGYLTTPGELVEARTKANQNLEPYKSSVASVISKAGSPASWSFGVVDPTNRDQLHRASALVYAKTLAYHLTGNAEYAATARAKVLELSSTNTCSNEYSGGNGCILTLSRHIPAYIAAADLLEDYPGWSASDKATFTNWLGTKVYRFTDWASDERSTNWGSVGSAATLYVADYFANSGQSLVDRDGRHFTAREAYAEARQRALDRNNSNSYMYNSVCSQTTGLGIQPTAEYPKRPVVVVRDAGVAIS